MNKHDKLYNRIMEQVELTPQHKPLYLQVKEYLALSIDLFNQSFTPSGRFAIVAVAMLAVSITQLEALEHEESFEQEEVISFAYQSEFNYMETE